MARYYRRRRYRKTDDGIGSAVSLLLLASLAYLYTQDGSLIEQHPYSVTTAALAVVAILTVIVTIAIRQALHRKHLYDAITLSSVDTMDGLEFERFLADLLRKLGYADVRLTERFDLGVDIIAKKDNITWGIQAKRYKSSVKAEAVRQAYTALNRYKCDRAMVITNSTFSRQAQMLASDNAITLIGRETLAEWIYTANSIKSNRGAIL